MTSRVRAAATHPAPSHPAPPLSPSLTLFSFALTLLVTRRLSGKPLHLAMRCESVGRGTQLVRCPKGERGETSRAAEEALTVPTSLPLANRDSTLMSSIFSGTFLPLFCSFSLFFSVFCYFLFFLLTMQLCENMRNCNNNNRNKQAQQQLKQHNKNNNNNIWCNYF